MVVEPLELPVKDLENVLIVCDPGEPLEPGDQRCMDFSFLRHSAGIVTLKKTLSASLRKGQFHHGCLCGHRGSGKSTELLSLKKWADHQGFQTVHAEVDAHVGIIELEFSDFSLLAATMVERAMLDLGKPNPFLRTNFAA